MCFFEVARFIISASYSLFISVVDIRGTITHIKYTDENGVSIGGSAKQAQIVLMRANIVPQHTQNYKKRKLHLKCLFSIYTAAIILLPEYSSTVR